MSGDHEDSRELEDSEGYDLTRAPTTENRGSTDSVNQRQQNIQWKPSSRTVEETLADGLSNEDLWLLIRRFNKQIYHVKAVQDATSQNLDLNRAEDEQFPPEKLRMTVERFYTSVVVGVTELFRHVGRLRSWREPGRTFVFTLVYFLSWYLDLLVPTIMSVLMALIMFPPVRPVLFPSAPASKNKSSPSGKDSQSQSQDSLTGAPEVHKGEAAEQEAKNMIDSVATIAMESAAGKYGQAVPQDLDEVPPPSEAVDVADISEEIGTEDPTDDRTKKPVRNKVSRGTDKAMRAISDITDIYEKFANLLSPTPPFLLVTPRLRLSGILGFICLVFPFVSSHAIIKTAGFMIGVGFFGDPLFTFGMGMLNRTIPNWKDQMDIQKTLLAGVPTNAQLTLTLFRIGEINSAPLPPPPNSGDNEPSWPIRRKKSSAKLLTRGSDLDSSLSPQTQGPNEPLPMGKPKKKWFYKVFKFVRRTIATAIRGHIAFDRAMAIAGSAHTKNLITMLQQKHFSSKPFGPLKFDAKFMKKRGAAVIDSTQEPPILYFTTYQSAGLDDLRLESRKKSSVLFQIPVTEIQELKKTEGLGWKGKLIVELTAGSKEAADGLVVIGKEDGQAYHLTGMRSRNQLFNRLVAMDAQFWESR
ncbi:hypothetical protein PEBR_35678 [Penicillium brasilianum]|uniref:Uncharacterized protein n=1 Tax=Penicillium brasilianum TaxID=104259 RepID=A0A1S9RDJ9_PENBI|nr:hypothetical protein PEBR_35678 [Penicillium brasilianum]